MDIKCEENGIQHQVEELWKKTNNRTLWHTMIAEVLDMAPRDNDTNDEFLKV